MRPSPVHLHPHHLDGDDGVVHQRPRARTRAPRETLCRPTPKKFHGEKSGGQHEGMESATTRPVRSPRPDEGDEQDDGHRFGQGADEGVDGPPHGVGLAGRLADLDADRQGGGDFGDAGAQGLAQDDDVAALGHGNTDRQGRLAGEADQGGGRLRRAAADVGDVAEAEAAVAGPYQGVGHRLDRVRRRSAGRECVRRRRRRPGTGDGVLLRQGLDDGRLVDAQGGELGVGQFDVDLSSWMPKISTLPTSSGTVRRRSRMRSAWSFSSG